MFDGVRNVKECRYIVHCLAAYKEHYDIRTTTRAAAAAAAPTGSSDADHDSSMNDEVMEASAATDPPIEINGLAADALEEVKFWHEIDETITQYGIGNGKRPAKHSDIVALVKFQEILQRIDLGGSNWARMKNYFDESDSLQALGLNDRQWKYCIDKFANQHNMSKYATLLNRKSGKAIRDKRMENNDEWQTQRLTLQRRLEVKTCNQCTARWIRTHYHHMSQAEREKTRPCQNPDCCFRCSGDGQTCIRCVKNGWKQLPPAADDTSSFSTPSSVNRHHDTASSGSGSTSTGSSSSSSSRREGGHGSDGMVRRLGTAMSFQDRHAQANRMVLTCSKCTTRYISRHDKCPLSSSHQKKNKNCLTPNCLFRCKKRSLTGYCKVCQRGRLINILSTQTTQTPNQ